MNYCTPCCHHNLVVETLRLSPKDIVEKCCEFLEIDIKRVMSKNRTRNLVDARNMIYDMLFCDKYINMNKSEIGRFMNGVDHSTIIHGLKTLRDQLDVNEDYKERYISMHMYVYNTTKYFMWHHENVKI